MEPNSFGKKLGIGLRVAGNIARDRAQEAARRREAAPQKPIAGYASRPSPPRGPVARAPVAQVLSRNSEEAVRRGRNLSQGIGRGSRQFGQSFFRPLAHASGVLWLEVTGCFFALFTAFFAQNVYHARAQYAAGPGHRHFLLYCLLTLLFAYFSASSFVKARRRSRKQATGR